MDESDDQGVYSKRNADSESSDSNDYEQNYNNKKQQQQKEQPKEQKSAPVAKPAAPARPFWALGPESIPSHPAHNTLAPTEGMLFEIRKSFFSFFFFLKMRLGD